MKTVYDLEPWMQYKHTLNKQIEWKLINLIACIKKQNCLQQQENIQEMTNYSDVPSHSLVLGQKKLMVI